MAQNKLAEAESTLVEGISTFEEARLYVGNEFRRAARGSPYTQLAAVRRTLGKHGEAWPAAERALGRTLSELIVAADRRFLAADEATREDRLKRDLNRLSTEYAALEWAAQFDSSEQSLAHLNEKQIELLNARTDWRSFRMEMAAEHPVYEEQTFSLERIQQSLAPETAIIGWVYSNFSFEDSSDESVAWGYVIRSSGPVRWVRLESTLEDESAGTLERSAEEYRHTLSTAASWPVRLTGIDIVSRQSRDVFAGWIDPLVHHLSGVSHLVILPCRPLLGVPIEALIDDSDGRLGDRYTITYAPSATIYTWLEERAHQEQLSSPGRTLLVGDPLYMAESEVGRLTKSLEEIQAISSILPAATVLSGAEASERKIKGMAEAEELREFDMIHIASHASVDTDHPEQSALILSQADKSDPLDVIENGQPAFDGLLSAEEIVRQFTLNSGLVTLSACRTTMANAPGGGFLDLSNAFLLAGARGVLVSLWNVSDDATSLLMRRFYENLIGAYSGNRGAGDSAAPMGKADALREAKLWLCEHEDEKGNRPYAHPAYWAGFILIGSLN